MSYDEHFHFQATGEDFSVEPADDRRPFRALLDVGLIRTTTGNRVFGALKVLNNKVNMPFFLLLCFSTIVFSFTVQNCIRVLQGAVQHYIGKIWLLIL